MFLYRFAALLSVPLAITLWHCCAVSVAYGLTASDLLIVYNRNMPASEEVAIYYASRRNVPKANLIGLMLPESEQISRTQYQNTLYTPLLEKVAELKKQGANPALLLIYGVPLKVESVDSKLSDELKMEGRTKANEISGLILEFIAQLDRLASGDVQFAPSHVQSETKDPQVIIERASEVINNLMLSEKGKDAPKLDTGSEVEISSLLIRLTGISPIAAGLKKQNMKEDKIVAETRPQESILFWSNILESGLAFIPFRGITKKSAPEIASRIRLSRGLIGELKFWHEIEQTTATDKSSASVDSELSMLLAEPYNKANWLPNPFLGRFDRVPFIDSIRRQTIMVARLDGPSTDVVKRMVDDAVQVEKEGLKGVFYIDARGLDAAKNTNSAYAVYDEYLRRLYEIVKQKSSFQVVFDNKEELFQEGGCPDAALYCGWYSLGKYIDAFNWKKGATGYHIASAEAISLRQGGGKLWCKTMLEKGVAATLGPVAEPYLQSFPRPDIFFPLLMQGKMPLLEVYYRSIPNLSWRQVLIGDPLYTPFREKPALAE